MPHLGCGGGGDERVMTPSLQGEQFYTCSTEASHHRWQPMRLPKLLEGISGLNPILIVACQVLASLVFQIVRGRETDSNKSGPYFCIPSNVMYCVYDLFVS